MVTAFLAAFDARSSSSPLPRMTRLPPERRMGEGPADGRPTWMIVELTNYLSNNHHAQRHIYVDVHGRHLPNPRLANGIAQVPCRAR